MGGIGKCRRSFHGLFAGTARTRNDLEGRPAPLPSHRAGPGDRDVLASNPRGEPVSIVSSRARRAYDPGEEWIPAALKLPAHKSSPSPNSSAEVGSGWAGFLEGSEHRLYSAIAHLIENAAIAARHIDWFQNVEVGCEFNTAACVGPRKL